MPTSVPASATIRQIEDFLLGLVSRDTGMTLEELREEAERCPYDPPWSSEEFVHYQFEIEEHFNVDFDPIEVEKVQRDLTQLAQFIRTKIAENQERTA
jgi:DNA-binding transcriptional MerR regulator